MESHAIGGGKEPDPEVHTRIALTSDPLTMDIETEQLLGLLQRGPTHVRWFTRNVLLEILPPGGPLPGLDQVDVDGFLVNFSRDAPFLMRLALFLSVMVYIFSTPITVFVPWPALWLPRGLRARHTARLATHPIYVVRQTMTMLKMVAGMAWGQDPAVRARLHLEAYEPDPATWRPAS